MALPKFSEDVRPLTDLRTKTAAVLEQVRRSRRPMLLTRRGRGMAVLLDLGEYERLADQAAFVTAINVGRNAARVGDLHANPQALSILEQFGKPDDQEA